MSSKSAQRAIEGVWIDPDFLPPKVRQELLDNLADSDLTLSQRDDFIAYTAQVVQEMQGDETEYAARVRQLQELANAAEALQRKAVELCDGAVEAFEAIEAHCRFSSQPPIELRQSVIAQLRADRAALLVEGLQWVEAIGQVAGHAASSIKVGRGARPAQHFAQGLLADLVRWVVDVTGSKPPKDRSSWFAGYAACLGQFLSRPMGPRVVSGAIEAIARTSKN
jgi:hypothetical protein